MRENEEVALERSVLRDEAWTLEPAMMPASMHTHHFFGRWPTAGQKTLTEGRRMSGVDSG